MTPGHFKDLFPVSPFHTGIFRSESSEIHLSSALITAAGSGMDALKFPEGNAPMVTDTISQNVELMTDLVHGGIKSSVKFKTFDLSLEGMILAAQNQRRGKTVLFTSENNGCGGNLQRSCGNQGLKLLGNVTVNSLSNSELSADDGNVHNNSPVLLTPEPVSEIMVYNLNPRPR